MVTTVSVFCRYYMCLLKMYSTLALIAKGLARALRPVFGVSDIARLKPVSTATDTS